MEERDAMIGQTITHYEVLEKIGEGGMGEVYRARDTRLERVVALKFLFPDLLVDPELKERFLQEAKTASVIDHPNVCTIHAIEETDDGRLFLAMAHYEGETLASRLQRGPLPTSEIIEFAWQICSGLEAAHQRGIVHLDIKPANILITRDGAVKILDFGMSRFVTTSDASQHDAEEDGRLRGSVPYLSPERIAGNPAGRESDLWALGIVLYEMATGRRPFGGVNKMGILFAIAHREPSPPRDLVPDIPPGLERAITQCLRKDPAQRVARAADVARWLEPLRAGSAGVPRAPFAERAATGTGGVKAAAPANSRRFGRWAVAVVLGIIALVAWAMRSGVVTLPGAAAAALVDPSMVSFAGLTPSDPASAAAETAWAGRALDELLTLDAGSTIGPGWHLAASPPDPRAGWFLGGQWTVLAGEPGRIRLEIVRRRATASAETRTSSWEGAVDELPDLAGRVVADLAAEFGLRPMAQVAVPAAPADEETARALDQARASLRRFQASQAWELVRSRPVNDSDPRWDWARTEILLTLGREAEARETSARAAAASLGLPLLERAEIRALELEAGRDWDDAAALWRMLWRLRAVTADGSSIPARVLDRSLDHGLACVEVLIQAGEPAGALELLEEVKPFLEGDPRPALLEARALSGQSYTQQLAAAERAASLAAKRGMALAEGRALALEGQARRGLGEVEKAIEDAEEAQRIAVRERDTFGEAGALMLLGNLYWDQQDLIAAKESYERAAQIFGTLGHANRTRALLNQALVLANRGELATAVALYREVLPDFIRSGDRLAVAATRFNLGEILASIGRAEEAERELDLSLEIAREVRNVALVNAIERAQSEVMVQTGRLLEARGLLERVLESQRGQTGGSLAGAITSSRIAWIDQHLGELDAAAKRQNEAFAIFQSYDNRRFMARILARRGEILLARGRFQEARSHLEEALHVQEDIVDPHSAATTLISLAQVDLAEADPIAAEGHARRSLDALSEGLAPLEDCRAQTVLAESLLAQGRVDEAATAVSAAKADLGDRLAALARLPLEIVMARLEDQTAARRRLEEARTIAVRGGLIPLELEIELQLGLLEMADDHERGKIRLRDLASRALRRDLVWIAQRAELALGAR